MKNKQLQHFIDRVDEKLKYAKPEDKIHIINGGVGAMGANGKNGVIVDNKFIKDIEDIKKRCSY